MKLRNLLLLLVVILPGTIGSIYGATDLAEICTEEGLSHVFCMICKAAWSCEADKVERLAAWCPQVFQLEARRIAEFQKEMECEEVEAEFKANKCPLSSLLDSKSLNEILFSLKQEISTLVQREPDDHLYILNHRSRPLPMVPTYEEKRKLDKIWRKETEERTVEEIVKLATFIDQLAQRYHRIKTAVEAARAIAKSKDVSAGAGDGRR